MPTLEGTLKKNRTIHGIDLTAPGGLEALFAYRRAQFGDAQMNANTGGEAPPTGETPPAGSEAPPAAPPAGETPPATPPAPPAPPAPAPPKATEPPKPTATPKTYDETYVKDLRDEAAGHRVRANQAEKATEAAVEAATRPLQVQLAITLAAPAVGANASDLLDSSKFQATIKDIDPKDTKAINTAIKSFVDDNPRFKQVQAAGASGANFTGGSGESAKKPTSLAGALNKHYGA